MRTVALYTSLIVLGLAGSQVLPNILGKEYETAAHVVKALTMIGLGFIMIQMGYGFDLDKSNLKGYGWDYVVAGTATAVPWVLCLLYFVFIFTSPDLWGSWVNWKNMALASRFAAPTSAAVLFSMLMAAGLKATWLFHKVRILAIFIDLNTALFLIPLMLMVLGPDWRFGFVIFLMAAMLWLAWTFLHRAWLPVSWPWVLSYATGIWLLSEWIYFTSKQIDEVVPIHIEVLLPAFVLGCMIAKRGASHIGLNELASGAPEDILESPREKRAGTIISAVFMFLVGLSMPALVGVSGSPEAVAAADRAVAEAYVLGAVTSRPDTAWLGWGWIAFHVLLVTIISNVGKMIPMFCYRKEAAWRQRLAVSVALFPRGAVGAGVLIISLSYGIGGPVMTVASFALASNLLLTAFFIVIVKKLLVCSPNLVSE